MKDGPASAPAVKQRRIGGSARHHRTVHLPSELDFPKDPQVTETAQDGFTGLRSWAAAPTHMSSCQSSLGALTL